MKLSVAAFGKLPPHLLAHDVSAAAVSCHFGPQSSEAEVPPGSLPLGLLLCSKRWFSLHHSKTQPSYFGPDPEWPVFVFIYFCVFWSGER